MPNLILKNKINLKKTKKRVEEFLLAENGIVMFFDEGRFGLQSTYTRIWSMRGEKTEVKVKQGYKNVYVYSAVCPFSGESLSFILPGVDTELMNTYLSELSKSLSGKKILLIMDQAGWHKSKGLKSLENIEIMFQPSYSPELNPVERLWRWLKRETLHNRIYESLEQLIKNIEEAFKKLTKEKLCNLCACSYL